MKIVTESGSTYILRGGLWNKNNTWWEKIWWAYCIHDEDLDKWANQEEIEKLEIQVGKKLYIGSKDSWWLSTRIVSIEEEDENDIPNY